jgi:hypothetical protein
VRPLDAGVFLKRCCDYGRLLSLFSICLRLIVSKYIEAPRLQSSHPSVDDIDYQVAAFLLVPAFIEGYHAFVCLVLIGSGHRVPFL